MFAVAFNRRIFGVCPQHSLPFRKSSLFLFWQKWKTQCYFVINRRGGNADSKSVFLGRISLALYNLRACYKLGCMGIFNSQNLKKSIILTCSLLIIYNIFVNSYSGIINESISIVSAVIGIIRYVKAKKGK